MGCFCGQSEPSSNTSEDTATTRDTLGRNISANGKKNNSSANNEFLQDNLSPVEQIQQLHMLAQYQNQRKNQTQDVCTIYSFVSLFYNISYEKNSSTKGLIEDLRSKSIFTIAGNKETKGTAETNLFPSNSNYNIDVQIRNKDKIVCPAFAVAKEILDEYLSTIPTEYFNEKGDRCFCLNCHQIRGDDAIYYRGMVGNRMKYAIPLGWCRFGLTVDPSAMMNNVFEDWHVSFHGTNFETVSKIFAARLLLLKPGDIALGGDELNVRSGHIKKPFERTNQYSNMREMFNPNQIFTSPSIKYASNDVYSYVFKCVLPSSSKSLNVKFAFQCRQRPGSYTIGQETIRATESGIIIDGHFSNNELEWYTQENVSICLHGLMIKVE